MTSSQTILRYKPVCVYDCDDKLKYYDNKWPFAISSSTTDCFCTDKKNWKRLMFVLKIQCIAEWNIHSFGLTTCDEQDWVFLRLLWRIYPVYTSPSVTFRVLGWLARATACMLDTQLTWSEISLLQPETCSLLSCVFPTFPRIHLMSLLVSLSSIHTRILLRNSIGLMTLFFFSLSAPSSPLFWLSLIRLSASALLVSFSPVTWPLSSGPRGHGVAGGPMAMRGLSEWNW